jgi:phosphoglycerate dehydrogenase-like enzyme
MSQPVTTSTIRTVLTVDVAPETVARAQAVSSRIRLTPSSEYEEDPAILHSAEVALVAGWTQCEGLREAPGLRWVQTSNVGVNRLLNEDLVARREVVITNARGIQAAAIAEHVFGLVLMLSRNLHVAAANQHLGVWNSEPYRQGIRDLPGRTLGVLGLGATGNRISQIGRAFGLRVVGLRRQPGAVEGVDRVYGPEEVEALLVESDVLVDALPLTRATRGLLGRREFALLPPKALFVNIGRGETVHTDALTEALQSGHLGGAGLDVVDPEPLPERHPLWRLPNVVLTPHYSAAHADYRKRRDELFIANLERYVAGQPLLNQVDKEQGY